MPSLTPHEFEQFARFIFDAAGISMGPVKMPLVAGRLGKRLQALGLESYAAYFDLLRDPAHAPERQLAVDLLTTNETYFFREAVHFDFIRAQALAHGRRAWPFRVWSAASSSGEEAYSVAMVLAQALPNAPWEVLGSDISARMVQAAQRGLYPMERGRHIPPELLQRYCRRGTGPYEGQFLIDRSLRARVAFRCANLNSDLPELGQFDLILLRNVMIYFNQQTKRDVVARVLARLRPGGHFLIGHAESLNDITEAVRPVALATYQSRELGRAAA